MSRNADSTADEIAAGHDLSERTIIVTGANTGIGFETARALAARGARVILACRNAVTGAEAVTRISERHAGARAELAVLDLASLESVAEFARGFSGQRVDTLICNAGLFASRYGETKDGFESTVGVCHIGHYALVHRLMESLCRATDPRVVMVSSESHRSPKTLDFDRFPLTRANYRNLVAYGQAKLCNVLFANELSRRYGARGLHGNSLHPGTLMTTDISRGSLMAKVAQLVARPFAKSLNQGAATTVYCAISPELAGIGGRYYRDCREARMSAGARDRDAARRLWALSAEWTGLGG